MAVDTFLVGNDGNFSYSIGTTVQTLFKVRSFAATLQRPVSDLTAFGDTGRRKRLGLLDLTGSLTAVVGVDSTGSANTATIFSSSQDYLGTVVTNNTNPIVSLTLAEDVGTTTNDAKIVADVVFSSFAFNSAKDGDTQMTVNFENCSGVAPVVTWVI